MLRTKNGEKREIPMNKTVKTVIIESAEIGTFLDVVITGAKSTYLMGSIDLKIN